MALALDVILSWYPNGNLDQLTSRWAGTEAELAARADAIKAHASDLASYAHFDKFIKERAEDGE